MNAIMRKATTIGACAAVALGAPGVLGAAQASVPAAAQAQASTYAAVRDTHIEVKLPKAWKSLVGKGETYGYASGKYHTDFYVSGPVSDYMPIRFDGYDKGSRGKAVTGKTVAKRSGCTWTFTNKAAGNTARVTVQNVYLDAWKASRVDELTISTKSWKKMIKEISCGKTSYYKVINWSKAKAKAKGVKAAKAYAKNYIVPNVSLR